MHAGEVSGIRLRPIGDPASEFGSLSFYAIEFSVAPFGNHITCVVLMDGKGVEPVKAEDPEAQAQ